MPKYCGVSLGVRSFARPLFLYIKLNQLRILPNDCNGVKLEAVKAYETALKRKFLLKKDCPARNKSGEYKNEKDPCRSCQVFFDCYKLTLITRPRTFVPFGNCAEYDVIRTNNLDSLLRDLERKTEHWALFESACEAHIQNFRQLSANLRTPVEPYEEIKTYYISTGDAKVLKYQKIGQPFNPEFKLIAENWRKPKTTHARNTQNKRRKTQ